MTALSGLCSRNKFPLTSLARPVTMARVLMKRRSLVLLGIGIAVGVALFTVHRTRVAAKHRSEPLLTKLAEAMRTMSFRLIRARLSAPFVHKTFRRMRISAGQRTDELPLDVRAAAQELVAHDDGTPRTEHAAGVALLISGDIEGAASRLLRAATMLRTSDAWNDYAAALLARSDEQNTLLPVIDSLAASAEALRIDPSHLGAHFNRALALEALGLLTEAKAEYSDWPEAGSPWAEEAARAASRIGNEINRGDLWSTQVSALQRAVTRNDAAEVLRIVALHPRDARAWGEGVFTASWATAAQRGDRADAERALAVARAIGVALHDIAGENLLADSVRTIDNADKSRRLMLARAYLAYRDGRIAHGNAAPADAERFLSEAVRDFTHAASPMQFLARYFVASALHAQSRIPEAAALLDELAARHFERQGYVALAGQIGWERGLCALVRGSFSSALDIFEESRRHFEHLNEPLIAATFDEFVAATLDYMGDDENAWRARRRALVIYSRTGADLRKLTALETATRSMVMRGQWKHAHPLLDLAVAGSAIRKDPTRAAEALLQRSIVRASVGDAEGASRDVAEMRRWVREISDAGQRQSLESEVLYAEAFALASTDPSRAIELLTRALSIVKQSDRSVYAAQILLDRGRIHRRRGDANAARTDFATGLSVIEQQRANVIDIQQRADLLSTAVDLFRAAIDLALATGNNDEAFSLTERSRARALLDGISERTAREPATLTRDAIAAALAPDAAIVQYVASNDRMAAFVLTRENLHVVQLATGDDWRALVEPVLPSLRGIRHLAVVADPRIAGVSFIALRSMASNRRLIDDYSVTLAPSASIAIMCSKQARVIEQRSTLVIAATSFDSNRHPRISPLPRAASEARSVAASYTRSRVLTDRKATPQRLRLELPSASIIHFAGHALARPERPLDSVLVLASDGITDEISASEISRLDLHRTRLVFLSACRSGLPTRASDGVQNLAAAFLIAGVPTIVATTTDV
ncbi:MAG TPA: CHAT domain-containing protein, partial [Thermoanaerobaculia bacterium]|nr:CHAT domain-containing protein [Thermoanaerobaculia bacterium]